MHEGQELFGVIHGQAERVSVHYAINLEHIKGQHSTRTIRNIEVNIHVAFFEHHKYQLSTMYFYQI